MHGPQELLVAGGGGEPAGQRPEHPGTHVGLQFGGNTAGLCLVGGDQAIDHVEA